MEYFDIPPALRVYFYLIALISILIFLLGMGSKLLILRRAGKSPPSFSLLRLVRMSISLPLHCGLPPGQEGLPKEQG